MPASLADIDPDFRQLVDQTLAACRQRGVEMVPYFGIRTPLEQGAFWRQSRSTQEINDKIAELRSKGASFLADCIEAAGPKFGAHVTNAIPGNSWHQWGEAVDCYWLYNGTAEWSIDRLGNKNGYRIYAEEGTGHGLTAGGYWQSIKDWPHLQKRKDDSPTKAGISIVEIEAKMRALFP